MKIDTWKRITRVQNQIEEKGKRNDDKKGRGVGTFFGRRDDGKRRRKGESGKKKSCLMKLRTFAYTSYTLSASPSSLLSQSPFLVCNFLRDLRLPLRVYLNAIKFACAGPL